jgi:hypothetical protein
MKGIGFYFIKVFLGQDLQDCQDLFFVRSPEESGQTPIAFGK